ncbi:MAG: prolyl oligopeptidase family serine peptidase [Actinomycetota bacterium]|nr:prolyl oligopeptidase family serine peptidase [Actinomycetota bacterium]
MTEATPCGTWQSPINAEMLVGGAVRLGEVVVDRENVWWAESRPEEDGRTVIVRDGIDQVGSNTNVRTLVHEYGGGAWWVTAGTLIYSEYSDQCLYRVRSDGRPTALTAEPAMPRGDRYADGRATPDSSWYVCVRERHPVGGGEASNEIVAVALDGSQQVEVLVSGPDFVAAPRPSPDGRQLAWIQWDHPDMPWDDTQLWVAELGDGVITEAQCVAADGESFFQPEWRADSVLHVVTDRDGWWHLNRFDAGRLVPLTTGMFEVGVPQWVFGQSRYAFVDDEIWFARRENGIDRLAILEGDGQIKQVALEATEIEAVTALGSGVAAVMASWTAEPAVVTTTRENSVVLSGRRDLGLEAQWFPVPEPVTFDSSCGEQAHAVVYPPTNPNHHVSQEERAPLLVLAHGGPTGAARRQLQLSVAYWTSRGFTVADVDYRGSTGYGRSYRHRLRDGWGVLDVDDCVAVAHHLVASDRVDKDRLAIKGGSAGGFTVLAALTFADTFTAGASRYGIADLAVLAADTHKFESRYLDRLVGCWPEDEITYRERSPIHHTDQLATPMLILQGSEDPIVPPNQAHLMADALRSRHVPFALVEFSDEGHGFRQASNIVRAIESELAFFARIFGFMPADNLPPLVIEGPVDGP